MLGNVPSNLYFPMDDEPVVSWISKYLTDYKIAITPIMSDLIDYFYNFVTTVLVMSLMH